MFTIILILLLGQPSEFFSLIFVAMFLPRLVRHSAVLSRDRSPERPGSKRNTTREAADVFLKRKDQRQLLRKIKLHGITLCLN